MTCIVGIAQKGLVVIGGDSAGVAGLSLSVRADEKVFRKGDFLYGFTTSYRMGQLLRYVFDPPRHHPGTDTMAYLVAEFIPALRQCFNANGYGQSHNHQDSGGCFLLGYRGEIFQIESDYQVARPMDEYAAVGCGFDLALGALHATQDGATEVGDRVVAALKAAAHHSAGVCPPFVIERLEPTEQLIH